MQLRKLGMKHESSQVFLLYQGKFLVLYPFSLKPASVNEDQQQAAN